MKTTLSNADKAILKTILAYTIQRGMTSFLIGFSEGLAEAPKAFIWAAVVEARIRAKNKVIKDTQTIEDVVVEIVFNLAGGFQERNHSAPSLPGKKGLI